MKLVSKSHPDGAIYKVVNSGLLPLWCSFPPAEYTQVGSVRMGDKILHGNYFVACQLLSSLLER